jgi:hypothetical protein
VADKDSREVRGGVGELARRAADQGSKATRAKEAVVARHRNSAAECRTSSRLPEADRDECGRDAVEDDVRKISTSMLLAEVAETLCGAAKVEPLARHEPVRLAEADEQEGRRARSQLPMEKLLEPVARYEDAARRERSQRGGDASR